MSQTDALKKIKVDYLYHSLRNPKPTISTKINQLRIIRTMNTKQYAQLKRQLPYIVCATFNPPYRRTENFAFTEYFILDIDHLYDKGKDLQQVRQQIQQDNRVMMCFLSPSEDGLKVLFRLKNRCYDSGLYSLFYKSFLKQFSQQYGLEQVIDERTSDVCRACFISIDPSVYYNPSSDSVDWETYIQRNDTCALFDLKTSLGKETVKAEKLVNKKDKCIDPDIEIMQRVKALLNPQTNLRTKPEPYVPQQLNDIMEELKTYVEETGVVLYEINNIQYGKKLRFRMGQKLAEINLFYGKNGFSIVQSPRCGTSPDFNELMSQLVNSFIYTLVGYG